MRRAVFSVVVLAMLGGVVNAAETVYQWRNADGGLMVSDQKPAPGIEYNSHTPRPGNISVSPASAAAAQSQQPITTPNPTSTPGATRTDSSAPATAASARTTGSTRDSAANAEPRDCEAVYGMSCEQVDSWETWAREQCGDDTRCSDPRYLERKYKPVPLADTRAIARRAAVRKNTTKREFTEYLMHTFTDMCAAQTRHSCPDLKTGNCVQLMRACQHDLQTSRLKVRLERLSPSQREELRQLADQYVADNSGNVQQLHYLLRKALSLMLLPAL
ncbi:MAG TPA: hypothetical protein VL027_00165 [Spongiibacteraceae bacterium]|jgi:hypothetical protein|nr:hypothetical protein [Spongiibacteraceae bacterium]HUH36335.1 hypothetical protein [Spongiibacteraceae bacterium]